MRNRRERQTAGATQNRWRAASAYLVYEWGEVHIDAHTEKRIY
jgi:hypothetical protein